jgi:hypothetical protein
MKKTLLAIALVLAVVGCKKDKDKEMAKDKPAGGGSAVAEAAHGPHHQRVSAELAKFQEALGEKWHAPKGEQRMKDTCAAVPQMETLSTDAAKLAAPAGVDGGKWTASTKDLETSIAELKGTCGGTDLAKFEPAFEKAHNAFHALIGMTGGHHEADGTHSHQM